MSSRATKTMDMNDVVQLLEIERAARMDAERIGTLKDRLLAAVAHELRTPIATLLLWDRILRETSDDSELRLRALDAIRRSATTQARLVGELVDVSRAASGTLSVEREPIIVDGILSAALSSIATAAAAMQVSVASSSVEQLGEMRADADRLRRAFETILTYALERPLPDATFTVSARREPDKIVIVINDCGRPIPAEVVPHLFDPFAQLERTWMKPDLGMIIASRVIALHGGTLVVDSERGPSSQFTITLPITDSRPASEATGSRTTRPQLGGVRVLIVDDEPDCREVLALLLEGANACVHVAGSASEARLALQDGDWHVLVCDVSMPDEDGYEFIHSLRASTGPARDIPAIALTANVTDGDRQRALAAGFDARAAKPVDLDHLLGTVKRLYSERSRRPRDEADR